MENLIIRRREYLIEKTVKVVDSHSTFLGQYKGKVYFVKTFVNLDEFNNELASYKKLKKMGISCPKLLRKDKKTLNIAFQYVDAKNMADVLSEGDIPDKCFQELFNIYRFARFSKIELNYLPEYFILENGKLYYTSYEVFPMNKEKNLENYGLRFWLYGDECAKHLNDLGLPVDKNRILAKGELNKKIVLLAIMKW